MLEAGNQAPNFVLNNQNDQEISLESLRGKWVVLYFYPKDNTPGCTKEACDFTESHNEYNKLDAVVLGVSPDSTASHRKFIEKQNITFDLLSDPEKEVHKSYGAWGLKKNYGKEYEGVIRSTFLINPEGEVAKSWKNVRVRVKRKAGEVRHADIVREALQELKG